MSKIYVLRDQNVFGFPRVSHPQLNTLRSWEDRITDHEQTCSRWKPSRVTISGEAAHLLAEAADECGMTQRELLEAMVHHGFSGLNRPGSWEASTPFNPYSYHGENAVADRWFR